MVNTDFNSSRIGGLSHTAPTNTQPQIGDQPVRQGGFEAVKRAFSDIGNRIQSFFSGLVTRFENWKEGRAVAQATQKANVAVEGLMDKLTTTGLGPQSFGLVEDLMKNSARANPNDPTALAKQLFREKLEGLPEDTKNKLLFTDLDTLGGQMKTLAGQRIDESVVIMQNLSQMGMSDSDEIPDPVQMKAQAGTRIDNQIGVLKEVFSEVRLSDVREKSGGVFTISDEGSVDGTVVNGQLPAKLTGTPMTPSEFIESQGQKRLDENLSGKKTFETVGGHQISGKATGDWHRMNINFNLDTGETYNTKLHGGTELIPAKLQTSSDKLTELTGSEQATSVLSSVLHQFELREIVHTFSDQSGGPVDLKPMLGGFDRAKVVHDNGMIEFFDDPGQIGDAQINVTKLPNGDFKVDIDWTYLSLGISDGKDTAPVDQGNPKFRPNDAQEASVVPTCIKVEMTGSFVISGTDANNGQLTLRPGARFEHTFSGTLAMPE